jgi:Gas vesicle synthesis protein GvpL/GvpF
MPRSNGTGAKYVYGVVRARPRPRRKQSGLHGKPVEMVTLDDLGALTSDVPEAPLEAGREELLTHSRVVETAFERGVVLPMRFGIVMPNEGTVRDELLGAHRDELEAQLDEMDGKAEVNVKGIYEEEAVLREAVAEQPEIRRLREQVRGKPEDATYYERIRLGEVVGEVLAGKREADEREIVDRLRSRALDVSVGQAVHERMAVNASFLLERERLDEFDRIVEEIGSDQAGRIRFKYTGPLPPYSFVELAVEE